MLPLEEKIEAGFDFYTRLLREDEKKYYGIFISHSNASQKDLDLLNSLRQALSEKEIYSLCDKECIKGGDDFQAKIEDALDCYGAVVIVTENSIRSSWVHYEVGYLKGRGKDVYVWDPDCLLSSKNRELDNSLKTLYSYFKNVGVIYNKMEDVIDAVSQASPYSEMFIEENEFLTCKEFYSRANERLVSVIATLESPIFEEHYSLFKDCKFGVLIPNFGMFYQEHGDGEHCYSKRNAPIANGTCPVSGKQCALVSREIINEENKECVVLNSVTYTGTLHRKGELDRTGEIYEESLVEFSVPVHKYLGTEFKFIIDVIDSQTHLAIMKILDNAGMNPTISETKRGSRIYLSLPQRRGQGLYRLDHQFNNNFLCPYATRQRGR